MILKNLQIQHKDYWRAEPQQHDYQGKIEFFNQKGEALTIILTEEQLHEVVDICTSAIVKAAQAAADSIKGSFMPMIEAPKTGE